MSPKSRTPSRAIRVLLAIAAASTGLMLAGPSASASASVSASASASASASVSVFGSVQGCVTPSASPLLTRWGDNNLYFPVTGGNVENPFALSLAGGASFSSENEPWKVLSRLDLHSVQLAAGATASFIPMCVPFVDDMRMFVKNPGVAGSLLHIHLDSLGSVNPLTADYAKHHATADYWVDGTVAGWNLIGGITIPDGLGADSTQSLTVTLSTSGSKATWKVDDILMDPWKAH